jgi:uncharacterized iron-regulated protein
MGGIIIALLALNTACAHTMIVDTGSGKTYTTEEFAGLQAGTGRILVFGEQHATKENEKDPATAEHHAHQTQLLGYMVRELTRSRMHLNVGMEFLTYPHQADTDAYVGGRLGEAAFLQAVQWGAKNPFQFYRDQIKMPALARGRTVALNMPSFVTSQVAKGGPDSLTSEQRALLPPVWERGGPEYFERFSETMQGHASPEQMENYFWAQSLWDDTMAWNAVKSLEADPAAMEVIIVGEFHTEFGHGLKARLLRQGAKQVSTLLQVPVTKWNDEELKKALAPDPRYGNRADYLWVYSTGSSLGGLPVSGKE